MAIDQAPTFFNFNRLVFSPGCSSGASRPLMDLNEPNFLRRAGFSKGVRRKRRSAGFEGQ